MGIQMYARGAQGEHPSPNALRDFKRASETVIERFGYVWGCLNDAELEGREPCGAVEDLMHISGEGEGWSAAQMKTGAVRAQEEFLEMKFRGELVNEDKHVAYACALAFIVTAAKHGLDVWISM